MEHWIRGAERTQWSNVTVHDAVKKDVTVSADEGTRKGNTPRNPGRAPKQAQGKLT